MRARPSGSAIVAVVLLTGSLVSERVPAQSLDSPQESALADTILTLTNAYNTAWEALDPEAILRLHSEDFRYYWRGSGEMSSKSEFERVLRDEILPDMTRWSAQVIDPQVEVLGRDAAVVSFEFTSESDDGAGVPYVYGRGALSYVFERREGGWKIVLIHESAFTEEPGIPSGPSADARPDESLVADLLRDLAGVEERVLALADAFGQTEYDWRPDEGVRSGGEAFMHVATINLAFPLMAGFEAPAETGLTLETLATAAPAYEGSLSAKADIRRALDISFQHLRSAIEGSASDLDREFAASGETVTHRRLWVDILGHLHEHLGQLIAYGRMNGIVPPWSG